MYSRLDYYPGYPFSSNRHGVEITILRFMIIPHITIVGVYSSPVVSVTELCNAIQEILDSLPTRVNIFIGDFNVNWFNDSRRSSLYNFFITQNGYRQLVSCSTTDSKTCIDHIYTNLSESEIQFQIVETYFSDHKPICALVNCFNQN